MTFLRNFFTAVARERRWWWAVLVINFFGSLYGFWWYKGQLLATPRWQWLIVPDSPGATFLLCIWLAFLIAGVDWRKPGMQVLGAIAFVSNMKYGLWTATVLPEAGFKFGWEFDFVMLSCSHAAMWIEGMLFARFYRPNLSAALWALGWMWFQDLIDYFVLNTHSTLPYDSELAFARFMAIFLSTLWGGFLVWQALRERKSLAA